jgi:hypothetical protein
MKPVGSSQPVTPKKTTVQAKKNDVINSIIGFLTPGDSLNLTMRNLPGSGNSPLDNPPPLVKKVVDKANKHAPRATSGIKGFWRVGAPVLSVLSFAWSGFETIKNWSKMKPVEQGLNVTATAATGVSAYGAIAEAMGKAGGLELSLKGGGIAGVIYAGMNAWNTMRNKNTTATQKGFALYQAAVSTAGAVAAFFPPVGTTIALGCWLGLGLGGSLVQAVVGKNPGVEKFFKSMGL